MSESETAPTPEPVEDVVARFRSAARAAERWLTASAPVGPGAELQAIAAESERLADPSRWDRYAEAGPVEELEVEVGRLLGKPAVAMFPSGIMAQQSVLRVHAESSRFVTGSRCLPCRTCSTTSSAARNMLHGFRYEWLTAGSAGADRRRPDRDSRSASVRRSSSCRCATPGTSCLAGTLGRVLRLPADERGDTAALRRRSALGEPALPGPLRSTRSRPSPTPSMCRSTRACSDFRRGGGRSRRPDRRSAAMAHPPRRNLYTMLPMPLRRFAGLREELPRMGEYHDRAVELAARLPQRGIRVCAGAAAYQCFPDIRRSATAREINERPCLVHGAPRA